MKTIKYYILGILMVSLSMSGINNLWGQKGSVKFMETYSCNEITSNLDQEDKFFQLLDLNQVDPTSSRIGNCNLNKASELWEYIHSDAFLQKLPDDIIFAWGVGHDDQPQKLYVLKQRGKSAPELDDTDIQNVSIMKDNQYENYSLLISFSEEGAKEWETLTGNNVGRDIAIVIDGKVYSAPRLSEQIKGGECSISGKFNKSEISRFKDLLEPSH